MSTGNWRAVAIPDAVAAWTAVAGGPASAWLFGPAGAWALVTGDGPVARSGTGPWRTAVGAVGMASMADTAGTAVVAGALTDGDRPGVCLVTGADVHVVDLPVDGPVGHWPVVAHCGVERVGVAWVDGDPPTLKLAELDPAVGSVDVIADLALHGAPWRLQVGCLDGGPVALVSDGTGTSLVDRQDRRRPIPDATGGSRLAGATIVTPRRPATVRILDIATWQQTELTVTTPTDVGDVRAAELIEITRPGAGGGTRTRFLHWHTGEHAEAGIASTAGWLAILNDDGRLGPAVPTPGGLGLVAPLRDHLVVVPCDIPTVIFVGLPA